MASRKQDSSAPEVALIVYPSRVEELWTVVLDGKRYEFGESPVIVGRAADCQIRVDDDAVTHHHAELTAETRIVQLRDLGSETGTWVDGERIVERTLRGGERIVVGPLTFHVVLATLPALSAAHQYEWRFKA